MHCIATVRPTHTVHRYYRYSSVAAAAGAAIRVSAAAVLPAAAVLAALPAASGCRRAMRRGKAPRIKSDRAGPVWRTGPPQTSVLIRYAALNFFYAGASVSGAIVLRSIMAHGPGRGGPGGVSGLGCVAVCKTVQKVYGSDRAHRSHSAHTHNYYKYVRSMCAQRNQHGNLNTRRAPTDGYMLMTLLRNQALTSPTPHEPPRGPR